MSEINTSLYRKIAGDYLASFKGYDVFVYLKTDEENFMSQKRLRDCEVSSIDRSYLSQLNKLYDITFDDLKEKQVVIILDTTEFSEKETFTAILKQPEK